MTIIGHRGARGLAPENTLASLQIALRHSAQELEFDVRVTRDRVPVLHHDPDIHDSSGNYRISEHTLAELTAHRPDLLTLETLFASLPHSTQLLIEIKPGEPVKPITHVIKKALQNGWRSDKLHVASFSLPVLREIARELPMVGLVVNERWSGVRAARRARSLHTKRLSMNQRWLWFGFIRAMHRQGFQLAAYTVNDPVKARRWRRHGLYGIITDYPDYFER